MHAIVRTTVRAAFVSAVGVSGALAQSSAGPYPARAPLDQYTYPTKAAEIALAKSAAAPSVADSANVLTLGAHGYETSVKGTNGFVCLVVRSWDADFSDPEFWNPKVRAPHCFNAPAAKSVLPNYLERTNLVLGGMSKDDIERRRAKDHAAHPVVPATGAMAYMLSKGGYINDIAGGPWTPHIMFFFPRGQGSTWGADLAGSPVVSNTSTVDPVTIVMIKVAKWSDGTAR